MKPKEKGDLAVAHAINYFLLSGYEVCLPIGDKKPYDLVVELNGGLQKVQVKYAGRWKADNKCHASLRTMGGNQSYYTAKKYSKTDFDLLFVHSENNNDYLVPWVEIENTNSLSIECGKFLQYKLQ